MAAEIDKINGIAFASIAKFNGKTDANIEKINGRSFEAPSFGPPEFDALGVGSAYGAGGIASTLTFSHTVGTGAGRGLVVLVMQLNPPSHPLAPSGITYDSVAMTQEATAIAGYSSSYNYVRTTIFSLIAPSSGENDCVVTFATSGVAWGGVVVGSLSFEGLNQTDMASVAFEATHAASGSSNDNLTHSNDATSTVAGQFCVSCIMWDGNAINEALGTNMSGQASSLGTGFGYQEATGTTTTMGYNFTNNASHRSAHVGLKLLSDVYS